jgi:predicted porin
MIKKILPVMIGAMLAVGMSGAVADITLFGHIDSSIDARDTDGVGDDVTLNCTTCSIGFKGSEDLGNGLKAIFSLDWQYDIDNRNSASSTTSALTDRDQWLGMAGGFGQVRVGTISTVYKSHGAMIDPLYRTALQGRDAGLQSSSFHNGAGEELEGRATNTIRYDSPDFNGIKVGATYTVDSNSTPEDDNPYGIGASYENGGILVFADYLNNEQGGVAKKEAWKVGGKYDMGLFSVMAQYEDFDDSMTTNDSITLWHVAGGVNNLLGMNIYLGFGQGDNSDTTEDYTAWTLAITHEFSKSFMVYAGHTQVFDCTIGGAAATLSACQPIGAAGTGSDHTAIGMKLRF